MKLKIEWSVEGQAINDFHCDELSRWIADELIEASPSSVFSFVKSKRGLCIRFVDNQATISISSELLVMHLRALVREGEIKDAELWFIDHPDKFGEKDTNMKLDKYGRCEIWPPGTNYSSNVLTRLI